MAGSLDQLVHFLVGKIEDVSSHQANGCTTNQILTFTDQFYTTPARENAQLNNITNEASSNPTTTNDTSFQEQIWTLLTNHPDVFVGKDGTFSYLPTPHIATTCSGESEPVAVSAHRTPELTDPRHSRAVASLARQDVASVADTVSRNGSAAQTNDDALHQLSAKSPEHDQFGSPSRPQSESQSAVAQPHPTDAVQSASLNGSKPSSEYVVAIESGHGSPGSMLLRTHLPQENDDHCGACGGLGELICCDGCSNAFHGDCLEPPIDMGDLSEDPWYCPRCETDGARNATSKLLSRKISMTAGSRRSAIQIAASTPRGSAAQQTPQTKQRGRPRKYLPGTEHFWRVQISTAPKSFASRPPDFDTTLIQAIDNWLPTPIDAADINQDWISKTLAVLNRSADGVYISPTGELQHWHKQHKTRSRIMIFKSARLREVDFSEGHAVSAVRFISSSAAHTSAYLRYYPNANNPAFSRLSEPAAFFEGHAVSAVRFISSSAAHTSAYLRYYPNANSPAFSRLSGSATSPAVTTPQHESRRKGPKLGIFYDEPYQLRNVRSSPFVPIGTSLRRRSGQSVSTVGSPAGPTGSPSQSRTTSPQPSSATTTEPKPSPDQLEPGGVYHSPIRPSSGLPPPLTTRAASKRQAAMRNGLTTGSDGGAQTSKMDTTPRQIIDTQRDTMSPQGQARKRSTANVDNDDARPKKRVKRTNPGQLRATSRQQMIVDMVKRCGGAIPDNSLLLRNALTAVLQRSDESGQMDKRTADATLKTICTAGKLKKSTFTFKDQRGFMVVSSVIAKPELKPTDPVMRQLQSKMAEVYPNNYIPPGMYDYNISQEEESRGHQHGEPPQQRTTGAKPPGTGAVSSALQPIENEALAQISNSGPTMGAESILNSDSLTGTALLHGQSDVSGATAPSSSAGAPPGEVSESFKFLRQQQNPIIFDPQISSNSPTTRRKPVKKTNRKLIWKEAPVARPMPRSLEEILQDGTRRTRSDYLSTEGTTGLRRFESEVDCVAKWEERSFNRFQQHNESQDWNFISHVVGPDFKAVRMESVPIHFKGLTWYDESGREKLYTPAELRRLKLDALNSQASPSGSTSSPAISEHLKEVGEILPLDIGEADSSFTDGSRHGTSMRKRKRQPTKTGSEKRRKPARTRPPKQTETENEPAYIDNPDGTVIDVSGYTNAPVKRPRGAQYLRNMSEADIYKLTVAIVVIRTLCGGLDKHIDWNLVARVFPDEDADFIRDRWRTIKNKFRRDVVALTENLQDRFCDAYVKGQVPDLDFDDLYNNDWDGVVEWAVRNLDKAYVKGTEDLPDTREEVAETKNMTFEEHRGMREHLGYNVSSSVPLREAAQASIVFAKPLESSRLQPPAFGPDLPKDENEQFNIAKSWALATVLTREGNFDANACKKKLSKLAKTPRASDALFDRALKSMVGEKTIVRARDGSTGVASRGYNASKLFYDALDARRTIQATILQQAARYRRDVLDPAFGAGQQVAFQPTSVQDGDMVAILNLLANGRARVQVGPDVPKNRYGLLNADGTGSYQTRYIDKEKLSFTVLIEAIDGKYVPGNPMETQIVPVPAIADYDKNAIPLWVDIHGNFQDELWELVVCAVVGLVSTRPGIDAKELVKTLSPSLKLWEVEVVLSWMERSGFIRVSGGGGGQGWETTEWWWLVCGGENGWHLGNLS